MIKVLKDTLMMIWQLPQIIFSFFVILFNDVVKIDYRDQSFLIYIKRFTAFSCGPFVFINEHMVSEDLIKHELGHSVQSRMLGPLYLFTVGLVSWTNKKLIEWHLLPYGNYFSRWPENWADQLGGVDRTLFAYNAYLGSTFDGTMSGMDWSDTKWDDYDWSSLKYEKTYTKPSTKASTFSKREWTDEEIEEEWAKWDEFKWKEMFSKYDDDTYDLVEEIL